MDLWLPELTGTLALRNARFEVQCISMTPAKPQVVTPLFLEQGCSCAYLGSDI